MSYNPPDPPEAKTVTELAALQDYPASHRFGDVEVTLRAMGAADRDKILAFTRELPESELLFLRIDITQPEVVDAWIANVETGKTITLLAEADGRLAGYCSLHHSEILWTRHFGEIRCLIGEEYRGKGLGKDLVRRICGLAGGLGLTKLVAHMLSSQRSAQSLLHDLGFIPEALLHDWAIDGNGRTHDLIVMSREVDELP